MYRRVLVATGGGAHSQRAVERAVQLARQFGAALEVVVVAPMTAGPLVGLAAGVPGGELLEAQAVQTADDTRQALLDTVLAQARAGGLEARGHLVQATPAADAIVQTAREVGADLIVLGRRHKTATGAALAGSVGDAVHHASPVDVLIVR